MEMLDVGVRRCGSRLGVGVEAEGSWKLVSQCPVQMANLRSSGHHVTRHRGGWPVDPVHMPATGHTSLG